jgi:peptidoglycan/LPS O-acetylase OafA/YrhL
MKYQWLDLLRGVSALLVCANHLRAAMFVDYAALKGNSVFIKLFYFLTGLGAQSVIVFFVLSGFFVGGSVVKRWQAFSFVDYLLARLIRLWVVLIPALLLTLVVDQFICRVAPDLFAGADFATINSGPDGHYSSSFATFLQNLFFLQTVTAPVFGSNGPLWSLSNEFWYYMTFPLFFLVFDYKGRRQVQIGAGLAVLVLGATVLQDKMAGFLVWTLGAGVYCTPRFQRMDRPWTLFLLASMVFLAALIMSKSHLVSGTLEMGALGIGVSLLILALREMPPMPPRLAAASEWLSRSSYTLYLVHFPFVLLTYVLFFRGEQFTLNMHSGLLFCGSLGALLLVAQCFWSMFEKHTDRVKHALLVFLNRKQAGSIQS